MRRSSTQGLALMADQTLRPAAYSVENAAKQLTLSRATVYNLINAGKLRSVQIGRRRIIPASEIDRLLAVDDVD